LESFFTIRHQIYSSSGLNIFKKKIEKMHKIITIGMLKG